MNPDDWKQKMPLADEALDCLEDAYDDLADDAAWDELSDPNWDDEVGDMGPEWGLPLNGDSFIDGEPRIRVDYFDYPCANGAAVLDRLLIIEHSLLDDGAVNSRVMIFSRCTPEGVFSPMDLIAIITLHGGVARLETPLADPNERLHSIVLEMLGPGAQLRLSCLEDPFQLDTVLH
ncbi:MAG: hypothetical protein HOI95_07715 [Chromatiales bacterium]|jgi:hypothetical protein|nr:hypothetical protein [Chromatiales bacterium]